MKRWLLGLVLSLATAGTMAQTIVDLDFVSQDMARGALLWDARDEGSFAKGHIPGAVNIGDPTLSLRDGIIEDYLPTTDLEKILGAAGIDPAREIVVYGDRGLPSVYFAQLTLRAFGAGNARVFHGSGVDGGRLHRFRHTRSQGFRLSFSPCADGSDQPTEPRALSAAAGLGF